MRATYIGVKQEKMADTATPPAPAASARAAAPTAQPIALTVQLPPQSPPDVHWTSYGTALGAPFVALVAALIAGSIAYRQWKTAQNKLKMDLFDKRMELYELVEGALAHMVRRTLNGETYRDYRIAVKKLPWLCSKEVQDFVEDHWEPSVSRFMEITHELENNPTLEEAQALHDEHQQAIMALMDQQFTGLKKAFDPYLSLSHL